MKIEVFVFTIALTVVVTAEKVNTRLPFEGINTLSENANRRKTARDDENSGKCGDLSWVFNNETSTLTIAGQGLMSCCTSSSTPWSHFSNQVQKIEIQEGVSSIGEYAFKDFTTLKTITMASNITSIGAYAFQDCKNLSSINIPSSVTSIGSYAFYGCESLASITIPSGVTSINDYAFNGCISLKSVNITSNITSIGSNAFF